MIYETESISKSVLINCSNSHKPIFIKTVKANIRNKIKRRVKNILDQNKNSVHSSYDYVIIIRKRLLELNYQEIEKELITLIEKIGEQNEKK